VKELTKTGGGAARRDGVQREEVHELRLARGILQDLSTRKGGGSESQ
jgi:hypothetical protein